MQKFKRRASRSRSENVQNYFFSPELCQVTHLQDLQKLRWPVMIVNLRKGQKQSKILKTITNSNKILLKFKTLKSSTPFIVSRDYPLSLFQAN